MKTTYLILFKACITGCIFAILNFTFLSCSDDKKEESEYDFHTLDESAWRYYDVENVWGTLEYSKVLNTWVITPYLFQPTPGFPLGGDDTGVLLAIVNMEEGYKQHIDQSVILKGKAIWKYTAHAKEGIVSYDICELTVEAVKPFNAPVYDPLSFVMVDMEVQGQEGTLVYRDNKWYVSLKNMDVIPELANKSDFDAIYISVESPDEDYQAGMSVLYQGEINSTYGLGYGSIMEFADGLRVYVFTGAKNYKISKIG